MKNNLNDKEYVIRISRFAITTADERIEQSWWWENDKNIKLMGNFLENEEIFEKALQGMLPREDIFLAKFMLNNAFCRDKDPFIQALQIIFLKDNLSRIIERNKGKSIVIEFEDRQKNNIGRIALVNEICESYSHVKVKAGSNANLSYFLYKNLLMKNIYPFAIWSHYFAECAWSLICRLAKKKKSRGNMIRNNIIMSNYRHYSENDENNPFWGNFTKLMNASNNHDFKILYYLAPTAAPISYYCSQFKDKEHLFFNDFMSFKDYFKNLRLYLKVRKKSPSRISFMYEKTDYGESIKPLIDAFFYVFYAPFLKNKSALLRLLKKNPGIIFTDSEMNLPAMQLGFLREKTKLFAMCNEVICETYAAFPIRQQQNRPSFDIKFVYNENAKQMLVEKFNYPASKMVIFPDPRFLESTFAKRKIENKILFISQMCEFFYPFTNNFNNLIKKTALAKNFELFFKPHPHEFLNPEKLLDKSITLLRENKLSFTPKYAINASSTLGLELLFQGSIVFFLDKVELGISKYFGISKGLPFLVCRNEKDVLKKIELLEKDKALYDKTRQDIERFLRREYGVEERDVLLKRLKTYVKP